MRNPSPSKMVREDKATWKSNYFMRIIVSFNLRCCNLTLIKVARVKLKFKRVGQTVGMLPLTPILFLLLMHLWLTVVTVVRNWLYLKRQKRKMQPSQNVYE